MSYIEIIDENLNKIRSNIDLIRRGWLRFIKRKLKEQKQKSTNPKIWESVEAKTIFKEIKLIQNKIDDFIKLENSIESLEELYFLIKNENDEDLIKDLFIESDKVLKLSEKIRYLNLMSDEADHYNTFLEIHAGAGGTESQDWALMLQRMYLRWAENQNDCNVSLFQETRGEEAGIKSCILKISKEYCYGWLKRESGIHRLVRISPFDTNKRRHTSFASVWVPWSWWEYWNRYKWIRLKDRYL